MRLHTRTGADRLTYGSHEHDKFGRGAYSNVQNDTGERIPFTPTPGLLARMRDLRDTRRLRGSRGRFTLDETREAERLAAEAIAGGWRYREVGRALGVSDTTAKKYAEADTPE